jgi:hypothetical protein
MANKKTFPQVIDQGTPAPTFKAETEKPLAPTTAPAEPQAETAQAKSENGDNANATSEPAAQAPFAVETEALEVARKRLTEATSAMSTGFSPEKLNELTAASAAVSSAETALKRAQDLAQAEVFASVTLAAALATVQSAVPHSVWGSQVRFEVIFTEGGNPQVKRIERAPAPAQQGRGVPSVTRNRRAASDGRDQRLPGVGWIFANERIVIRILHDDSGDVSAWEPGGLPSQYGALSSACTKILGTSRNGFEVTNLGGVDVVWDDERPAKGWRRMAKDANGRYVMPSDLKPASF